MREVLAHPLLGRQGDVAAAQEVKNRLAPVLPAHPHVVGRQVQLLFCHTCKGKHSDLNLQTLRNFFV